MILDYVQANGPQTYSKLHEVVLTVTGNPLTRKNYGSAFLDQVSSGSACRENKNDNRVLIKCGDNLYRMAYRTSPRDEWAWCESCR